MEKFMLLIIRQAVKLASPEIREGIRVMVAEWVVKAKTTDNPWDDIVSGLLQTIIGKPDDPIE